VVIYLHIGLNVGPLLVGLILGLDACRKYHRIAPSFGDVQACYDRGYRRN
jgi:hypothetical protein